MAVFAFLVLNSSRTTAEITNVVAELDQLRTVYEEAIFKINTDYTEISRNWPSQYSEKLEALLQNKRKAGNFEAWQAVTNELSRFRETAVINSQDLVSSPADLLSIQKEFKDIGPKQDRLRNENVVSLTRKYLDRLLSMQKSLTIDGRMEEALKVNEELKRVKVLPQFTAAEFALAAQENQTPDQNPAAQPEQAVQPGNNIQAGKDKEFEVPETVKIYQGQKPADSGSYYKSLPVSVRAKSEDGRKISTILLIAKKNAEPASPLPRSGPITARRRNDPMQNVMLRVSLKTTSADAILTNHIMVVQFFAKDSSPKTKRELQTELIPLPTIDFNKIVYIDCTPVLSSAASLFSGLILYVFDGNKKIVFQALSNDNLEQMVVEEIPKSCYVERAKQLCRTARDAYRTAYNTYLRNTTDTAALQTSRIKYADFQEKLKQYQTLAPDAPPP